MKVLTPMRTMRHNSTMMLCLATGLAISICVIGCTEQTTTSGTNGTSPGSGTATSASSSAPRDEDSARLTTHSLRVIETRGETVTLVTPEDLVVKRNTERNRDELDDWLSAATAVSSCGVNSFNNDVANGIVELNAAGSATVTWTARDDCGESLSASATFTVEGTGDPTLDLIVPENLELDCADPDRQEAIDQWLDSATAEGECTGITIANDFQGLSDDCGDTGTATVTWTATDDCGNSETDSATVTVSDSTPPTVDGPDSLALPCDDDDLATKIEAWLASATGSDDCGPVELTNDYEASTEPCVDGTEITLVTWTATDLCLQTGTHSATLTLFGPDTTLTLTAPEDLNLDCADPDRQEAIDQWLESATAEGDCTGIDVVNDFQGLSDDCGDTGTASVTWTATDDCGNNESDSANVAVTDSTPPTVDGPDDLTVACDDETIETQIEEWLASATGSDNCGSAEVTNDFSSINGECADGVSSTEVTWTATDQCLQSATHIASLLVTDDIPPTIIGPEDMTVECGDPDTQTKLDAWLASAEASDNCGDADLSNNFDGLSDDCGETGSATVTWTATDSCGNTNTHTATFAIVDTTPPTIELRGDEHVTLECGVDEYEEQGADASDGCDTGDIEVTIGGDEVDSNTAGEYIVEYTATDACGNEASVTRTVVVENAQPPTIPDDQLIQIWPPNHKYHTFQLSDCGIEDDCETDLDVNEMGTITSIYSDEPEDSTGDGITTDDIIIVDASTFSVRAERRGGSNGRVYGVNFEVSDSAGNTLVGVCRVGVPHDQSGSLPVDDGPEAGYTVD